jgi:hypothetical protein
MLLEKHTLTRTTTIPNYIIEATGIDWKRRMHSEYSEQSTKSFDLELGRPRIGCGPPLAWAEQQKRPPRNTRGGLF